MVQWNSQRIEMHQPRFESRSGQFLTIVVAHLWLEYFSMSAIAFDMI